MISETNQPRFLGGSPNLDFSHTWKNKKDMIAAIYFVLSLVSPH